MTSSASLLTFITSTGLAGLALAFIKDIAEASRPPQSVHSNGARLRQEHPRAVHSLSTACILPVGVGHRLVSSREEQSTTGRTRDVQNVFAGFSNGHG